MKAIALWGVILAVLVGCVLRAAPPTDLGVVTIIPLPEKPAPVIRGLAVYSCGQLMGVSVALPGGWDHYPIEAVLSDTDIQDALRHVEFETVYLRGPYCVCQAPSHVET